MEPETTSYQTSRDDSHLSRAFTLIELLVIIAIILLLAAILFPVFARAKSAAHRTRDLAHIKQVGLGQILYSSDNNDYYLAFPRAGFSTSPQILNGLAGPFWSDRQMPYVRSTEIYKNPQNENQVVVMDGYLSAGATEPGQPATYPVHFALNPALTRALNNPILTGASSASAVMDPAKVVLVGPSHNAWQFSMCVEHPAGSQQMHFAWMFSQTGAGWGFELFGGNNEKGGFDGGANFTYTDSHAKFRRTIDQGTHPGDRYPYKGRDFFRGTFHDVIVRENVSSDGTCPADRGAFAY